MKIAIVMGSKSDLPVAEKAIGKLKSFGVEVCVRVLSAHRTPQETAEFAAGARQAGMAAIIAVAGKAAALPGALAACTTLPVIGLPVKSSFMDGMDSLLSMAMMPPGIPVATVGTDAGENAALLALEILAVKDEALAQALEADRVRMAQGVLKADDEIRREY